MSTVNYLIAGIFAGSLMATATSAQTRLEHDTATAYGARLNAGRQPANLNQRRVNSRIQSRLDTRLALRIERYRPENTVNPAAAYSAQSQQTDNSRVAPIIAAPLAQEDTGQ